MRRVWWAAMAAALTAAAPGLARAADTGIVRWNDITLQGIRDTHPGPTIVARDLAIVDTCMYDAWTAYDPAAAPTQANGIAKRPASEATDDNKLKAVSFAAYRAVVDLFPTDLPGTGADALMAALGYDPSDTSTDTTTPSGIGNVACQAVLNFRHHDGSNQLGDLNGGAPYSDYTGYVPVNTPDQINDPNRWQPLRVSDGKGGFVVQTYVTPFWAQVKPFNPFLIIPPTAGPNTFPSVGYAQDVEEILRFSANLNDTSKTIAEYWRDGPKSEQPPGHWSLFAEFVSRRDAHTLDQDAEMFFAQSNAIFDASIISWGLKRQYDSDRPITAIHFFRAGQMVKAWAGPGLGTQMIDGSTWQPYQPVTVVTPAFPEYVSGHSIFSAAGAEILERFTGSDVFGSSFTQPAHASEVEPGITPAQPVTLSWATFTEAANQAGISRRYGGIHFKEGDLTARHLGHQIGTCDWFLAKAYFSGHPESFRNGYPGCFNLIIADATVVSDGAFAPDLTTTPPNDTGMVATTATDPGAAQGN